MGYPAQDKVTVWIETGVGLPFSSTRTCTFCDVKYARRPAPLDGTEPQRIADAVEFRRPQ